jgi:hypothetical protein
MVWRTPHSLKDSNANPKVKTMEGVGVRFLARNTSGVEGHAASPRWRIRTNDKQVNYSHKPNNKLINVWLEHFWCTDKPRAYTDPQDSPRLGLGGNTTFPLIVFYVPSHGAYTQMSFCLKIPNLGVWNSRKWDYHDFGGPLRFVKTFN